MDAALLPVLVTAGVSVLTTFVALLYGPAWKNRIDSRRAKQNRSAELLARYSEPLARAAFDLQSRLYNICQGRFATSRSVSDDYRILSTQWLFGQFLAWMEIVRREVQVIDYGDLRRTAELQRHLFDVSDILASTTVGDPAFRLFRVEQRAIGELMVVERSADRRRRNDCMGYAEFVRRIERDASFARWFEPLSSGMKDLRDLGSHPVRAALTQRALIDLIDFFDPEQVRFPDVNERGKVPEPPEVVDPKRIRPASQIARFRYLTDPFTSIESWANKHGLKIMLGDTERTVRMRGRYLLRCYLRAIKKGQWIELHVARTTDQTATNDVNDHVKMPTELLTRSQLRIVNDLLRDLGRPKLIQPSKRSVDW